MDVNNDGFPDLILGSLNLLRPSLILLNNATGHFLGPQIVLPGPPEAFRSGTVTDIVSADLNGDGNQDLIVALRYIFGHERLPVDGDLAFLEHHAAAAVALAAAVLPSSRSVQVGVPATAFATIINLGASTAISCRPTPATSLPATFTFQPTDPRTNRTMATPNTPVDIAAGRAQSVVFALTPTAPIVPTEVAFSFGCANSDPAPSTPGLNTLLLAASASPVPDIVALAATLTNDGIVTIPGATGTGAFAVATVNVGVGGTITATADTGGVSLPVSLALCQTNPTTGACLAPPASSVTIRIEANATPTFGIFVQAMGIVPFVPAMNRLFVRFKDSGGVTRGATSVAVRTP